MSYSAAKSACEKDSQREAALRLLQGKPKISKTPKAVLYNAATRAMAHWGPIEQADGAPVSKADGEPIDKTTSNESE